MTRREFRRAVNELSDRQYEELLVAFGGGERSRKKFAEEFAPELKPEHDQRLCQLLEKITGLTHQTEKEKRTRAALESARSARYSAIASAASAVIALISAGVVLFGRGCAGT